MVGLYRDENGQYSRYAEKDQKRAIQLLYSHEYIKGKEQIMLPLDEFLIYLENRIDTKVARIKNDINIYINSLILLFAVFIAVLIIALYMVSRKILSPIAYLSEAMYRFRNSNSNSTATDAKVFYDDEIGYMSTQFYEMRDSINQDIKMISDNERKVKDYVSLVDKNIITSSTDLSGTITYVSEAFVKISGYSKNELLGSTHSKVKHPDMPPHTYEELWDSITHNRAWHGEIKNKTKNGGFYWVDATIYPVYDEKNKKVGYTAIRVDITDHKKVEYLLKESELNGKTIQDYIDLIDKNIITSSTDLSGTIIYVSEAFVKISGYSKNELLGSTHSKVKHPDMPPHTYEELWDSITHNRAWHGEIKNKTKNGGFYWVDAIIYPLFNAKGEKTGYTAIRIDITDKKRVEELLITDGLTKIYNRRYFNESLPKAINIAKRDQKFFSFLIMDIDHFKLYNDTYGHQAGDHVLIEVAKAIEGSLQRGSDMCFRLGGEEFGVIFESLTPNEAYQFADKIRQNIENIHIEHAKNSASSYITASMGLVTKKNTDILADDLIYKEADEYLYKAKESGRNKVEANER